MKYDEAYQQRFIDIFEGLPSRRLFLFGAGRYAAHYIERYGDYYPIEAIVDNDEKRWGEQWCGVEIKSPQCLTKMPSEDFKIIICLNDYEPAEKQLREIGIHSSSVYDMNKDYIRERKPTVSLLQNSTQKKYRVGYIAGVFDLFHIGHLNLFKRAKAQCEYLIVGVVTDEGVLSYKKAMPFVPYEERVEMVRSCRYVDEVVKIPPRFCDTYDMWKMYRFDVQFSGSDYEHDPLWLAKKQFLEDRGATMVFFPYTESTSSTKLKKLIEKKLL